MSSTAGLLLDGIVKRFGDVSALSGLELEVEPGEFFVILGPSAAGKTTTLRVAAGLERPDAGRVLFGGRDLTDAPVQGRGMSMIFQTFALYPHLTVRANLAYPLREQGLGRGKIGEQVEEIAAMLRIGHTLDRKPATLSGGEQQRLAIGRALIQRPELLLLDEPLTNLDAKLRHDTRAEFKRLHRELGMTMVYATPDQLEALSMGERIAVLREGRIVQTGTPDALYDHPADSFVATMVGAPPMNLVEGQLRDGAAGTVVALPFSELDAGRWRDAPDSAVLFGIRPHDLAPVRGAASGPTFEAKVHLTEPLGDVTLLDIEANGAVLKMALPEEDALAYPPGSALSVELALERAHLFDRATGLAV
ncbi:MAG: ABC transporter ATP-binding protein [Kiloniellales bacterium]|nr:ABC transporter ATP-binding protein [Kiloniellales bacterium]